MADMGHDIFLTNVRGNRFSQKHVEYDMQDKEFWDYDLNGSVEDVIASAKLMNEVAGAGKGYYFGYSAGTTISMIALATREEEMAEYFNRVVLLSPCFFT